MPKTPTKRYSHVPWSAYGSIKLDIFTFIIFLILSILIIRYYL